MLELCGALLEELCPRARRVGGLNEPDERLLSRNDDIAWVVVSIVEPGSSKRGVVSLAPCAGVVAQGCLRGIYATKEGVSESEVEAGEFVGVEVKWLICSFAECLVVVAVGVSGCQVQRMYKDILTPVGCSIQ